MIFVAGAAFCQKFPDNSSPGTDLFNVRTSYKASFVPGNVHFFRSGTQKNPGLTRNVDTGPVPDFYPVMFSVIKADYYTCNFGFFCKKELQFEKATKIPLRFRLGSLQYNDYLEQKPNAVNLIK